MSKAVDICVVYSLLARYALLSRTLGVDRLGAIAARAYAKSIHGFNTYELDQFIRDEVCKLHADGDSEAVEGSPVD